LVALRINTLLGTPHPHRSYQQLISTGKTENAALGRQLLQHPIQAKLSTNCITKTKKNNTEYLAQIFQLFCKKCTGYRPNNNICQTTTGNIKIEGTEKDILEKKGWPLIRVSNET
jgi:hypothetical protein